MGEYSSVMACREALRDPHAAGTNSETEDSKQGQMIRCVYSDRRESFISFAWLDLFL